MTVAEALEWIANLFEEPPGRITSDTIRSDVPAWDSLGQLILMAALDQQWGIRLSQRELPSLTSVGDVLAILGRSWREPAFADAFLTRLTRRRGARRGRGRLGARGELDGRGSLDRR